MTPYPWQEQKNFTRQRVWSSWTRQVSRVLTVVGFLCSPLSLVVRLWAYVGFNHYNDAWAKRGLIATVFGAVATALFVGATPMELVSLWTDIAYALGDKATEPVGDAVTRWLLGGFFVGVFFMGLASLGSSAHYEYASQRYLRTRKPTVTTRVRAWLNARKIRTGEYPRPGHAVFGVISDDPLPWRTHRIGQVVQRPMNKANGAAHGLGHGAILGSNDTGKTKFAENLVSQFVDDGGSAIYVDFKGSTTTRNSLRGIADTVGVPFYSFTLGGVADGSQCSYDPLAWDGTPSEKTSMLMEAFNFAEGGAAEFYRNAAEAWLPLQFEAMDAVGLQPGEGSFDFLLSTCYPNDLLTRVGHLKSSNPQDYALWEVFSERAKGTTAVNLTGLRNNLERVVNAAGPHLRPSSGGMQHLDLRKVADEGALVYIGLSATSDATTMTTVGSLTIRDLTSMIGERLQGDVATLRPVLFMPDEASRLRKRAVVMDAAFTQAREAKVWMWPITQTFSSWPESTMQELLQNAMTLILFRITDTDTAAVISKGLGNTTPHVQVRQGQRIKQRGWLEAEVHADNEGHRSIVAGPRLSVEKLTETPAHHAYVIVRGDSNISLSQKPVRSRRVPDDEVPFDIPQVKVILRNEVATPPSPEEDVEGVFTEAVSAAGEGHVVDSGLYLGQETPPSRVVFPWHESGDEGEGAGWEEPAPTPPVPSLPVVSKGKRGRKSSPWT